MSQIVRVGRKYALYLPREVVEKLNIREGDKLLVMLRDGEIVLRPLPRLLRKRRYWAETTVEEFEAESQKLVEASEAD